MKEKKKLGILSVFLTVDGECNFHAQGCGTIFVRTRGCSVGCVWCDTKYSWAFKGGAEFLPWELVEEVEKISKANGDVKKVTLTGGEPLEQDHGALATFIELLSRNGYSVTVETSGTRSVLDFRMNFGYMLPYAPSKLSFVVDYKLQRSRFKGEMDLEGHFAWLSEGDFIKFVINSPDDFLEAVGVVRYLGKQKSCHARIYFSPVHGVVTPGELLRWMSSAKLLGKVGLNVQAHKYVFDKDARNEEGLSGIDFTKRGLGRPEFLRRMHGEESDNG